MGHTTYNIFVNGFRTEALADTGAWLNLVSESYLQRNPGPWIIVPDQYQLRVGNGKECRLSGYVQAMIRVGDCEELNQITLYIIDGLLFDVVLGHKFLNTTGMVQFSPGGTKRVYIHSTGSSQPNNAMILAANLADVRGPPLLQRMKMCFGLGRRPPSADARAVLESFNLRQREREERVPYCNTSGAMIDLPGAPILGVALPQLPPLVHLAI
ncbi:uncharacterized protein RCO7_06222 [Rhynchosporium graminicola]|uniref:Uncharacterized protein n=1 Tax=Rhynchosporium graminicola TaxID=2792576 RepID=A0A1E1KYG1_9HELO|nr:uncharacterized protein RCO7_06222 [Rhynchosporium commune]